MGEAKAWAADQSLVKEEVAGVAQTPPPRKIHPLVRLDYPVRTVAHVLVLAILLSELVAANWPVRTWVAIGIVYLLWPHLACMTT